VLGQVRGARNTQGLVLTEQRALIIKVGWKAGQTFGGKVTSFEYCNITSIEVRASILTGTFEIATGGVQGTERSYWRDSGRSGSAWRAPHIIPIFKSQQSTFQRVAAFIRERSTSPSATTLPAAAIEPDIPDQIRQLAALRDDGIITAGEFEGKKASLLARM